LITSIPFYHGTTRNLVIAFCGLFSNIFLRTRDADGVTRKIVNVPISFLSKEKFLVRLMQDPGLNEDTMLVLPRLSAELTGITYDQSRQLNKMQKVVSSTPTRAVYYYAPVPYVVSFNLYTYTKTVEDNLQIMEQILPFFAPDMNLSIKMLEEPELLQDIPMMLNSVSTDDQFDGSFETTRTIISTYSFSMKAYYYGPILNSIDLENHFDSSSNAQVIKQVNININNNIKYTAVVNPFEANKDDIYSIDENWVTIVPTAGDPTL
jgi:hypothetical protein